MNWLDVKSSNIRRIRYKDSAEELTVEFHNGGTYLYLEVPITTVLKFMGAKSMGSYFAHNIKDQFETIKQGD